MQEEKQKPGPKLDTSTYFLMGGVGLFFDITGALLNLIPIAGQILEEGNDLFADMIFWLWFEMKGMKYKKSTMIGAYILKFIPFLNILPEYTLMIVVMYMQAKTKEKLANVPKIQTISKTPENN